MQDAVNVIGHDHKFISREFNIRAQWGGFEPFFCRDLPEKVEDHNAIHDFTQESLTLIGDERDEICPRLGIIISRPANGMTLGEIGRAFNVGGGAYWIDFNRTDRRFTPSRIMRVCRRCRLTQAFLISGFFYKGWTIRKRIEYCLHCPL